MKTQMVKGNQKNQKHTETDQMKRKRDLDRIVYDYMIGKHKPDELRNLYLKREKKNPTH